jgi:hypothetical protein
MELVKPPSAGKVRELAPLVTGNTWCIRGDTALFRRIRYIKSRVLLLLLLRRIASRTFTFLLVSSLALASDPCQ